MTFSGLLMFDGSFKIHYFIDFWHLFFWRLWRTGKFLLTKSKGHRSNSHYSGFPNYLQTKSNLYISICQSQIHYIKSKWGTLYLKNMTKNWSKMASTRTKSWQVTLYTVSSSSECMGKTFQAATTNTWELFDPTSLLQNIFLISAKLNFHQPLVCSTVRDI